MTPDPIVGETLFHHYLEIFVAASIPIASAFLAWAFRILFGMKSTIDLTALEVNVIKTNHLVHIDQKIDSAVVDLKELRGQFIDHITKGKD